jgi:hypothetical protein
LYANAVQGVAIYKSDAMRYQDSAIVQCPYCGESIDVAVDPSVPRQEYIEDCPVCCRPMTIQLEIDAKGKPIIRARREDD